jgi:short subunit dehydrogenase-like uncharacterized protein
MFGKVCGYTYLENKIVLLKTIGPTSMERLCLEMGVHYIHLLGETPFLLKSWPHLYGIIVIGNWARYTQH